MSNLFAVLPLLKARLQNMPNVVRVQSIQELAQLLDSREIVPQDGAVYVGLDGWKPHPSSINQRRQKRKTLSFSVILAKQFYGAYDVPHDEAATGEMLDAICATLQGWQPLDERGKPSIVSSPFDEVQALEPMYYDNFALYPLRFETEILSTYSGN